MLTSFTTSVEAYEKIIHSYENSSNTKEEVVSFLVEYLEKQVVWSNNLSEILSKTHMKSFLEAIATDMYTNVIERYSKDGEEDAWDVFETLDTIVTNILTYYLRNLFDNIYGEFSDIKRGFENEHEYCIDELHDCQYHVEQLEDKIDSLNADVSMLEDMNREISMERDKLEDECNAWKEELSRDIGYI